MHKLFPRQVFSFPMYIDGKFTEKSKKILRESPAHGLPVSEIPEGEPEDLENAVRAAKRAFDKGPWSEFSGSQRAEILLKIGDAILANKDRLALVESLETGKPISQAKGEIAGAADIWRYAAGLSRIVHGDIHNNLGSDKLGLVLREPIGVVGLITPWNFPFLILSERLPFILAAGCTAVIKPSEMTGGTTLMLGEILDNAGLPAGVVNLVSGYGPVIGQRMAEHPDIDMISFTGSTLNGKKVMTAAASNIKKVGLELGGKNPMIVFADADQEDVVDGAVFSAYFNAGQCCISSSRLLVEESIAEELIEKIILASAEVKTGETLDHDTQFGAIVNSTQMEKITGAVESAKQEGAKILCGGNPLEIQGGRFFQPTLISGVKPDANVMKEEIFGPVIAVQTFKTEEEAIDIANSTQYGLAGSIWTKNIDRGLRTVKKIRSGKTWINSTIEGYPELPIGGFKQSGLGRETGRFGIEEYTELKTVLVHLGKRQKVWL